MEKTPKNGWKLRLDPLYDIERIASSTECTGIAPAPILDEDAAETYARLYAIHTPQVDTDAKPDKR